MAAAAAISCGSLSVMAAPPLSVAGGTLPDAASSHSALRRASVAAVTRPLAAAIRSSAVSQWP
jgi:hypothetical protein